MVVHSQLYTAGLTQLIQITSNSWFNLYIQAFYILLWIEKMGKRFKIFPKDIAVLSQFIMKLL